MKKVFKQITEIVDTDPRKKSFTIVSWAYIDILLEIYYADCYEYYMAEYDHKNNVYGDLKRVGYGDDFEDYHSDKNHKDTYKRIDNIIKYLENKKH